MPKIRTILTTTVLAVGMLSGPSMAVMAGTGDYKLQENTYNDEFSPLTVDPYAGLVRLVLVVPEKKTLKRIVTARPDEEQYRLMSEYDAAALGILDGEADGLLIAEYENPGERVWRQTFSDWVGFSMYDYLSGGVRFMERNPADVLYLGVVLEDTVTRVESRSYYKIDYRDCAHERPVIDGEATMCDAEQRGETAYFVPTGREVLGKTPTWEEELAELAKDAVREYFDALEALEAMQAAGGQISEEQIGALEAKQEEIGASLTKFSKVKVADALVGEYQARLEALRRGMLDKQDPNDAADEKSQSGSGMGNGAGGMVNGKEDEQPKETGDAAGATQVTDATAGTMGTVGNAGVMTVVGTEFATVGTNDTGQDAVVGTETEEMDRLQEVAVPKLGSEASWWERHSTALLIVGASLIGVVGWLLIGVLGKKRKQQER